jgi:glycosyltransferase involved in cell wall biosynthesis
MLVTIIIPTFERAGFIETAIESVLQQDHPEIELIVLDDGSTDETPAVLQRIAERTNSERFRWARHDNVGQAETINRGLAQARGELVGYLSSDDYLLKGAVSRLVRAAEEHPDADVVYPWCHVVDETDRITDTLEYVEHTLVDAVRWGACLIGSGALVRRRYYERVGGWDTSYRTCPDFEWWLRGGDVRFVCVREPLAVWRGHDGSLSTTTAMREKTDELLRMLDELFARDDLPAEVAAVQHEAYASILIAAGSALLGPEDDDPRFGVYDRIGNRWSLSERQARDEAVAWLAEQARRFEHQVQVTEVMSEERYRRAQALEGIVADRQARIAELEGQLEAARAARPAPEPPAPPSRPLWLRVGRRLTPRRLRHRLGAAVHRLRSRA